MLANNLLIFYLCFRTCVCLLNSRLTFEVMSVIAAANQVTANLTLPDLRLPYKLQRWKHGND